MKFVKNRVFEHKFLALMTLGLMLAVGLFVLQSEPVEANPNHFAGDYLMFAKVDALGITADRKKRLNQIAMVQTTDRPNFQGARMF